METQKTIAREGQVSGIGLHTGKESRVFLKPAPPDSGIRFYHEGRFLSGLSSESHFDNSVHSIRCSALGNEEDRILTVEHLLAALGGLGITNLQLDVHGPEIPGTDGSALPFVELIQALGVTDQGKAIDSYRVTEPIFCGDQKKAIAIYPSDTLSIAYVLDYEHPYLRGQKVEFEITPETFARDIAPARTFCTEEEAQGLKERGIGLGADRTNTVVVDAQGSHRANQRFEDECARHKVLDIVGDLNLLGFPIQGRVVAIRSGHTLNRQLVRAIRQQRDAGT